VAAAAPFVLGQPRIKIFSESLGHDMARKSSFASCYSPYHIKYDAQGPGSSRVGCIIKLILL
jgi:hypothetical protein